MNSDERETLGYEIVIRFYPGAGPEARTLFARLGWPDEQVAWMRAIARKSSAVDRR